MTQYLFDHDRLDVYRLSIDYVASAFDSSRSLAMKIDGVSETQSEYYADEHEYEHEHEHG
jgi:hypothetical protein